MNITIRRETANDFRTVEELTREAFWVNTYSRHLIDEHLLVHKLRSVPAFVPELDYVAEISGKIVGNVMYSKAKIVSIDGNEHEVLTFGPLSVLPEFQNQGVGKELMRFTIGEAKRLGYSAIVFFGHPDYYPRFGFRRGADFGLTAEKGQTPDAFMAMELYAGTLDGIQGKFYEDPVFHNLPEDEVIAFDKSFSPKEPHKKLLMNILLDRMEPMAREALKSLGMTYLSDLRRVSQREISKLPGIDTHAKNIILTIMKEHGHIWGEGGQTDANS